MEEKILKIFADSAARYFATVADGSARLGTPYLRDETEDPALDYAAVIGISGHYRGRVCYTASREKLHALLPQLGEDEFDERLCADLVGEITNTISGNARESLGAGFMISPPVLLLSAASANATSFAESGALPCYVLPVTWKEHHSRVLVTLQAQSVHRPAPDAT
jgi:chemotaxis protein CheX